MLRADDGSLVIVIFTEGFVPSSSCFIFNIWNFSPVQTVRVREGLGIATCNVAEYRGIILGLKYALIKGFSSIRVQGDSKLVCMQVIISYF